LPWIISAWRSSGSLASHGNIGGIPRLLQGANGDLGPFLSIFHIDLVNCLSILLQGLEVWSQLLLLLLSEFLSNFLQLEGRLLPGTNNILNLGIIDGDRGGRGSGEQCKCSEFHIY